MKEKQHQFFILPQLQPGKFKPGRKWQRFIARGVVPDVRNQAKKLWRAQAYQPAWNGSNKSELLSAGSGVEQPGDVSPAALATASQES